MKRFAAIAGAVSAAVFFAGIAAGAEPPGRIVLKVYPKRPVTFDHKAHAGRVGDCQKCHHMSKPGDEEKCSECHSAKGEKDTPSFREALHLRCRNCHMMDNRKVKGSCKECHPEVKSKL
jgi:hypothetical protein